MGKLGTFRHCQFVLELAAAEQEVGAAPKGSDYWRNEAVQLATVLSDYTGYVSIDKEN